MNHFIQRYRLNKLASEPDVVRYIIFMTIAWLMLSAIIGLISMFHYLEIESSPSTTLAILKGLSAFIISISIGVVLSVISLSIAFRFVQK